jgi:adenylyltransferase/sulfurtransferase
MFFFKRNQGNKVKMEILAEEPVVVDVREIHEWQSERIPNTIHIPLGQIAHRANELDQESEIILHCHSGMRSARAQRYLISRGFKNVLNLKGGISAWVRAGGKTHRGH